MCTVTYIPAGDKIFLTSNRDERRLRRSATTPLLYPRNTGLMLFPRDGEAGGSWFVVHENGNALVLLNGAWTAHLSKPPYRKSRGLVLLELADNKHPLGAFREMDLDGIEPFTVVLLEGRQLNVVRWDGSEKYEESLDASIPHIWSSVTLYDPAMIDKRRGWFDAWLLENPSPDQDDILRLHQLTGDGDRRYDLLMNRDNRLLTVSITSLQQTSKEALLQYVDIKGQQTSRQRLLFTKERMESV